MRYLKDLLYTEKFLIKGHANTGGQRLSTFLNKTRKHFLEMEDATLIRHDGGDRILTPWMLARLDNIILAYENEESGDEGLKILAERESDRIEVKAFFSGNCSLQLSGKMRKRAMDSDAIRHQDFIVMVEPKLQGFRANKAAREYSVFDNLSYVIVNRNCLAFIFR
jgi:hypothetical protein